MRLRSSVALATYQGERFLAQQLDSFLTQTRLPDELCISDDKSKDGTREVIRKFAERAPFPVKVSTNPQRGGVNRNFENAISMCTMDVVLFADQDDVWLPSHVEALLAPLEGNPGIVAVASDSQFVDESLNSMACTQFESDRFPVALRDATMRLPANQLELVLRQNMATGHGMAFRRSLVPLLLPFTDTVLYDEWVMLLAAAAGYITYVPTPQTLHRQHQTQTVATRNKALSTWADQSKNVSSEQEQVQEDRWKEVLERVREHREMLRDAAGAERTILAKYDFVVRRRMTRRRPLPARFLITMRELMLGRYHRLGRGLLTFARDLYGVKQNR